MGVRGNHPTTYKPKMQQTNQEHIFATLKAQEHAFAQRWDEAYAILTEWSFNTEEVTALINHLKEVGYGNG